MLEKLGLSTELYERRRFDSTEEEARELKEEEELRRRDGIDLGGGERESNTRKVEGGRWKVTDTR